MDSFQDKIELIMDVSEIEADIEAAAELRDMAMEVRLKAARELKNVASNTTSDKLTAGTTSTVVSSGSSSQTARLPKLELPKFGGAILEWDPFWDQFQAGIDASEIPEVTKLVYLKSLLFGEAKLAVE